MTDNDYLGQWVHIDAVFDCAVGLMVAPDIIVARRVLEGRGSPLHSGVWNISRNRGLHLAKDCKR